MSDSIFTQATPDAVIDPQPASVLPPEVEEFVGSGKKYSSVEDALKSVPHAQKHIQTLEQELAQIKEELSKRKTAEELLDEIKSGVTPIEKPSTVEIPQDKIFATIEQVLERKEAERTAQKNISVVTSTFTSVFGEKAEEAFIHIAQESGLTIQQLNKLSASSPMAVLKLAGLEKKQEIPAKQSSSINTEAFKTSERTAEISAKVPKGASTKDMVAAWRAAGEKVKQSQK